MTAEHPEDWSPGPSADDVHQAIASARAEANEHNAEYAAGIRLACSIIEDELDC